MESKKINQLATNLAPLSTDLTIVGDPITGVSKKITLSQIANLFAGSIDFYTNLAAFPVTGTINIIYCAKDTQKLYLWSGSAYVETFPSQAVLNTYQLLSAKGIANGYASLDSAGKVPIAQLPSSIMEYKGLWSAATNTPTLANGTGDTGDVYICSAAGSVNFGAGAITFAVGDYVIYSGSIWQRSSGAVGTVTSVGLSSATSGVTIGSSPVTTSGTITLAIATATTSQNGLLSSTDWATFNAKQNTITLTTTGTSGASTLVGATLNIPNYGSALTGYVPYTGATQDVDLGAFSLNGKSLHIKGTAGNGHLGLKHQSVAATGSANESLIYADSLGDLSWQNANLYLSKFITSANTANRSYTFPNATCNIPDDSLVVHLAGTETITGAKTFSGYTTFTSTVDITSGLTFSNSGFTLVLQPPTLSVNRTVTLPNGTGTLALTSDISYPVTSVFGRTGAVVATSGDYTTAQVTESGNLYYTDTRSRLALSGSTGISYNNTTGVITNSAPDQVVALTASTGISVTGTYPNFTITNTSPSSGGTVTSVAALTIGTSGTDLSSTVANSTTTPVITLNVPTASAANRGALSSADWTTFNNKQATITLTTTGTSGAATFTSNTLNIPNYGSALSGYLPLTGGTLTGALGGTSATFSGQLVLNAANNQIRSGNELRFYRTDNGIYTQLYDGGGANGFVIDNRNGDGFNFQSAGTSQMRISSSGNLGLGVTPSAWNVGKGIQIGNLDGATIWGYSGSAQFGNNFYWNGGFLYSTSAEASRYAQGSGAHQWFTAPSGTAGAAITFTQAMTLDASGNLGVGETSPSSFGKLAVYGGAANTIVSIKTNSFDGTYYAALNFSTGGQGANDPQAQIRVVGENNYSASIRFLTQTSGTVNPLVEKMRLFNDGNLLIQSGGTFTNAGYKLDVNGTGRFSGNLTATATSASAPSTGTGLYLGYGASVNNYNGINFQGVSATDMYFGRALSSDDLVIRSSAGEKIRFTSSGNVGIGITPSAWATSNDVRAIQLKAGAFWNYSDFSTYFGLNYYWDGSVRKYIISDYASEYQQVSGQHIWFTAPSGTAGTTATFTERMRITSGGALVIKGFSTNTAASAVIENGNSNLAFYATEGSATTKDIYFASGGSAGAPNMTFKADGNLLVGTTDNGSGAKLVFYSTTAAQQLKAAGTAPAITFSNTITSPTIGGSLGACTSAGQFLSGTAAGDMILINQFTGNKLYITNYSGGVYLTQGATSWTANSDIRLKNINSHIENAVEKLSTLQTINFSYKDDKTNKQNLGLIAQEVEKIFPELIDKNGDGMLGVRYTELVPVLIKAIQEQQKEINELKLKIK